MEHLNLASFEAQLHTSFHIRLSEGPQITLELFKAEDRSSSARQERFSVFFRGPLEIFLPQRMYPLVHEQLGTLDLFLVPVAQEADGFVYEAVFNRLVKKVDA